VRTGAENFGVNKCGKVVREAEKGLERAFFLLFC
jgi:hypothetical protein